MKLKIGKIRKDSQLAVINPAPAQPERPAPEPPKPVEFTLTKQGAELLSTLEAILTAIQSKLSRPRRIKAPKAGAKKIRTN